MQFFNLKAYSLKLWKNERFFDLALLFIQLTILLCIAFPSGLRTSRAFWDIPYGTMFSGPEISKLFPSYDVGLYLLGAQKFLSGWLHGSDSWFLACWPPGFFLIESFFMKIFGLNCPIVLCLALTTVVCWTITLWNFYLTLRQWQPRLIAGILSMSVCFTQLFDQFVLRHGVILSEPISLALLILCLSLSCRKSAKSNISILIVAGACLAGAAYMRSQFDLLSSCLVVLLLVYSLILFIASDKYRTVVFRSRSLKEILVIPMHRLLMVALCAQLCMLPYRINNYIQFGTLSWVRLDYYWQSVWQSESQIRKNAGIAFVIGGICVPTILNPQLAKEIEDNTKKFGPNYYSYNFYKDAAIKTFIKDPFKWLALKASYVHYTWFDSFYKTLAEVPQPENWFYAILFCFALSLSLFRIGFAGSDLYSDTIVDLFFLNTFIAQLVCGIFFHFEARYFYLLKISSVIVSTIYIAIYSSPKRNNIITKKYTPAKLQKEAVPTLL